MTNEQIDQEERLPVLRAALKAETTLNAELIAGLHQMKRELYAMKAAKAEAVVEHAPAMALADPDEAEKATEAKATARQTATKAGKRSRR